MNCRTHVPGSHNSRPICCTTYTFSKPWPLLIAAKYAAKTSETIAWLEPNGVSCHPAPPTNNPGKKQLLRCAGILQSRVEVQQRQQYLSVLCSRTNVNMTKEKHRISMTAIRLVKNVGARTTTSCGKNCHQHLHPSTASLNTAASLAELVPISSECKEVLAACLKR